MHKSLKRSLVRFHTFRLKQRCKSFSYFQQNCRVEIINEIQQPWGWVEMEGHKYIINVVIRYNCWVQRRLKVAFLYQYVWRRLVGAKSLPFFEQAKAEKGERVFPLFDKPICLLFGLAPKFTLTTPEHTHLHTLTAAPTHGRCSQITPEGHEGGRLCGDAGVGFGCSSLTTFCLPLPLLYIQATRSICIGAMKYGCCVEGRETSDLSLPHENC